jgi:hypothetical protein
LTDDSWQMTVDRWQYKKWRFNQVTFRSSDRWLIDRWRFDQVTNDVLIDKQSFGHSIKWQLTNDVSIKWQLTNDVSIKWKMTYWQMTFRLNNFSMNWFIITELTFRTNDQWHINNKLNCFLKSSRVSNLKLFLVVGSLMMKIKLFLWVAFALASVWANNDNDNDDSDDVMRYVRTFCFIVKNSEPDLYRSHNLVETCLYKVQVYGQKVKRNVKQ